MAFRYIATVNGRRHSELLAHRRPDLALSSAVEYTRQLARAAMAEGGTWSFQVHGPRFPVTLADRLESRCDAGGCMQGEISLTPLPPAA